jgi:hypothetical protein
VSIFSSFIRNIGWRSERWTEILWFRYILAISLSFYFRYCIFKPSHVCDNISKVI